MEKLSAEQVKNLPLLKKGRYTRVHMNLAQLQPGEGIKILKETDWLGKHPPYRIANRFAKKHGWKLKTGRSPDGKGWVFIRLS